MIYHPLKTYQNHSKRIEKGKMTQKREKNNEEEGRHYPSSLGENTIQPPMLVAAFDTSAFLGNPSPTPQVYIPVTSPPPRTEWSSVPTHLAQYTQPQVLGHSLPQNAIPSTLLATYSPAPHFQPETSLQWHRPYSDLVESCRLPIWS